MSHRDDHTPEELTERRRRPYTPPAIEESAVFETLALACIQTVGDISCDPSFGFSTGPVNVS
ncbi:MAG: hypothetical protein KC619_22535 [Myxococcales bacterium]|nr:hypothetical protein [Myxococcales bacterium]